MRSINQPAWTIITPSMSFLLITRRAAAFIRTCLPAEPASWLLLLGATFLFICNRLRWWPRPGFYPSTPYLWEGSIYLLSAPILAAGIAACYLGLVGFRNPARRLLDSVLVPAAMGLLATVIVVFFWFRDVGERAYFVAQFHGAAHLWNPRILLALVVNLGTGFQFASIGFILLAAFFVLYSWNRAALPVRLPAVSIFGASSSDADHRRTMFFVWSMVAMVFITGLPETALEVSGYSGIVRFMRLHSDWFFWLRQLLQALLLLAFICVALGKSGRKMIPAMLRIPRVQYVAIAVLIPAAIAIVAPLCSYLYARVFWSAHGWGAHPSPLARSFFGLPSIADIWYFVPALVEEIAWRGYLQPRFIRRYGLVRGIFLVGVVWGAFHFCWDFKSYMTAGDVGIRLVVRLANTVCLSYVLAWLTIRSESVMPAAVAHAAYNTFLTLPSLPIHSPLWLTSLLWALAGFVLLRYFSPPPVTTVAESAIAPAPEPEPSEV
jgi:membrane protease YdiL (CAAX protease family)